MKIWFVDCRVCDCVHVCCGSYTDKLSVVPLVYQLVGVHTSLWS